MNFQTYPFPSQRMPLFAANGVVATSQPLAAQAGLSMLQRGGNAVDAALAAAVALTVVEPTSNGIGGDAFALVWDGTRLHGLNASGRAPAALRAEAIRAQGYTQIPEDGWLPVTVPGAPAAWGDLHERFGRLPLEEIMAPAITYAGEGYGVTPIVAHNWQLAAEYYRTLPDSIFASWLETFTRGGRAPRAGERWLSQAHAQTLRALVERGVRDFYEGELAAKIVQFARATGGLLTADDLASHQSRWVEPIKTGYRGYEVWEIPPNGQGLAALLALALLEGTDLPTHPHGSTASLHLQIEAMKLAFADAQRYIADPEQVTVPVAGLLDPAYLAARRALIGPRARLPEPGEPFRGGTVYLCAADRDGMMVSYIQSNYGGFGSGLVVPGTGIALHNRGACFTLEPGHPNEAAGGHRPFHTIIPAFLTRGGQPVGPFGVMGGHMQPQGHTQVVVGTVDYGLNPQAALDAPRWRWASGLEVGFELDTPEHVLQALAARGHRVQIGLDRADFGRGQIIWRLDEGVYVAGSDKRSDGAAVGW
ncbi:MAG: gamma-glutamyltransferase family protein [Anaerolineae bacterium]|nr:gamma-glutamyltransferase family protein [Anaerolineae bacterium]